jgi:hypothetical protein
MPSGAQQCAFTLKDLIFSTPVTVSIVDEKEFHVASGLVRRTDSHRHPAASFNDPGSPFDKPLVKTRKNRNRIPKADGGGAGIKVFTHAAEQNACNEQG